MPTLSRTLSRTLLALAAVAACLAVVPDSAHRRRRTAVGRLGRAGRVVGLGGGLLASGALLLLIGLRSERPARR